MNGTGDSMSGRERLLARILKWAPWLSFFLVAVPFPVFFLLLFSVSASPEAAALYFFAALISLALGSIVGFALMIFLFVYRKRWHKRLRDRMAADGITADELSWFMSELTTAERQALKSIEGQNPL